MGLDDYAAVGGGALKLKGAKVAKKKKKSSKPATDLEKNLSTGAPVEEQQLSKKDKQKRADEHEDKDERTRAAKDDDNDNDDDDDNDEPEFEKTESERRHEEARKKRLLQITQAGGSRPELLKTHKERVEKLNTYLSRLSEHHDMPKIGPG